MGMFIDRVTVTRYLLSSNSYSQSTSKMMVTICKRANKTKSPGFIRIVFAFAFCRGALFLYNDYVRSVFKLVIIVHFAK